MLNRREVIQTGVLGAVFGFLFRGRTGSLQAEPIEPAQVPSSAVITCAPQRAFRAERLIIAGTVVGKRMVPTKDFVPCVACGDNDDDLDFCEACDGNGGHLIETGEMREEDIRVVPWMIEDISIGDESQPSGAGSLPGDLFSSSAIDSFVRFDAAGATKQIKFRVSYIGDKPEGEVFMATMIGSDETGRRVMLPICSGRAIAA